LTLSAATLMRDKVLRPGLSSKSSLSWTNNTSIGFDVNLGTESGTARLHYTCLNSGESVDYLVRLTTTPLAWGGRRWWFLCPLSVNGRSCGRRAGNLYSPPGARYFGCRRCHDLTYRSCQASHTKLGEFGRWLRLAGRFR
jgi:hypothetical protein